MALGKLVSAPFHILDEFDVFMVRPVPCAMNPKVSPPRPALREVVFIEPKPQIVDCAARKTV